MAGKFSVSGEQYRNISRRMREIQRQLDQNGGSPINPREVMVALQCIVENKVFGVGVCETHTLEVNYDQPLEEAIKAGGYKWTCSDLNSEHFPRTRSGIETIEVHLVCTGRQMNTDEPWKEIDKLGLRPATIEELLAFGANPDTRDLQRQFLVVALGSVWARSNDHRYMPALWHSPSTITPGRGVGLKLIMGGWIWDSFDRFLSVKK